MEGGRCSDVEAVDMKIAHPSERGLSNPFPTGPQMILGAVRCYIGGSSKSSQSTNDNRIAVTDQGVVVKDSDLSDKSVTNTGFLLTGQNAGTINISQPSEEDSRNLEALLASQSGQASLVSKLLGTEEKQAAQLDKYFKFAAIGALGIGGVWLVSRVVKGKA